VAASAAVARLPLMPAAAEWVHIARTSVVMDTRRAKTVLGWQPHHTSRETLDELAAVL
jgi:nucleoside-diphosphate-sugar epimerase